MDENKSTEVVAQEATESAKAIVTELEKQAPAQNVYMPIVPSTDSEFVPPAKKRGRGLLIAIGILYGLCLVSFAGVYATNDYTTASNLSGVTFYSGLAGAIVLAIFIAGVVNRGMKSTKSSSKALRIFLVIISTLAGGVGGIVVAAVLGFIASSRACELSSSKCF
jgi:hypothetical protein